MLVRMSFLGPLTCSEIWCHIQDRNAIIFYFNRGKTHFDTCPYISISAYHWYPQQINGHKFDGKNGDSIQLPERVLAFFPVNTTSDEGCRFLQFIEYSSQQWFLTGGQESALSNKVICHRRSVLSLLCDVLHGRSL